MTKLSEYKAGNVIKGLLMGHATTGKSGALASLVEAGYNLRIIDFDKGLGVLQNILRHKNPALLEKVDTISVSDEYKSIGGRITCTKATAWALANKYLTSWEPYGPLDTWTPNDILVIDSLTFAGKSAMNFISAINGRLGQRPYQSDFFEGQTLVDNMCSLLHSDTIQCNIICITHIRELSRVVTRTNAKGDPIKVPIEGTERGMPETGTGQALSDTIGRHFNTILLAELNYGKREIFTLPRPGSNISLKSAMPSTIPASYPLETGLAQYFEAVRGKLK